MGQARLRLVAECGERFARVVCANTGWRKPFLVAFSDSDPIIGAMAPVFTRVVPGTAGIEQPVLTGAGHFLQEDAGERLAQAIVHFVAAS